jgi:hypothetical protein
VEPRNEEPGQERVQEQPKEPPKKRRFQLIKLEERIAPNRGGNATNNDCTAGCFHCHRSF